MKPIEMNYKSGSNTYEVCYPQSQSDLILLSESARNTFGLGDGSTIDDALTESIAEDLVPVGSVFWYTSQTAPLGYLICDGSQVSRTDYGGLFNVIGTTFGSGDGSSTFALPNLQASFIRGSESQDGYSATFGQKQEATAFPQAGYQPNFSAVLNADKSIQQGTSTRYAGSQTYPSDKTIYLRYFRPYNTALTPLIKY